MTSRSSSAILLGLPLVLLLCLVLYWPGLAGPFLLDDWQNIVASYVPTADWRRILYVSTHNESGPLGRPLSVFSFLLSGLAHGPEPWGYKYHNLLLHLCNGLLLFWLLLKLLPRLAGGLTPREAQLLAGTVAAAWLLHPLMVSTVLYSVQRMAELSATFTLLALLAYVTARDALDLGGWRFRVCGLVLLPACLLLGLASKENAALIPLFIGAIELLVFRREAADRPARRRLMVLLVSSVALPLVLGAAYALLTLEPFGDFAHRDFSRGQRLLTQLRVLGFYLKLILLPRLVDLSLFHDDVEPLRHLDLTAAVLLAVLAAGAVVAFRQRRSAPLAAFALAWFLFAHSLESTIPDLELVFEHRNYLAAVAPLLLLFRGLLKWRQGRWYAPLAVASLVLLSLLTFARVQEWSRADLLFAMAVRDHPQSLRARLGYADLLQAQGRRDEALEHLDAALRIRTKDFGPVLHKLAHLCRADADGGETRQREIAALLRRAERKAAAFPVSPHGLSALESLFVRQAQGRCPALSLERLQAVAAAALGQAANRRDARRLGYLQRLAGQIWLRRGQHERGLSCLRAAYRNTGLPIMLAELVTAQLDLGRLEQASRSLAMLEAENRASGGLETYLLEPLRDRLRQARAVGEAGR